MQRERFQLALERLPASAWRLFEETASAFLTDEFPNLQPMASESGDRGRDAVLWQPEADPTVALQFSVTKDWSGKLRDTADRLKSEFAGTTVLVYATNQVIGPAADSVIEEIRRELGLFISIRDQNWFLDRANGSASTESAAERVASHVVDPLLAGSGVIEGKAQALDSNEARAALVYLNLQLEDDISQKGLTKLSFEALVRAVLRETNADNRLTRDAVKERVRFLLPAHEYEFDNVDEYVEAALARMTKKSIRHYSKTDEFCLAEPPRVSWRLQTVRGWSHDDRNQVSARSA